MSVHIAGLVIVRMQTWDHGFAILKSFVPSGSSASLLAGLPVWVPLLIGLGMVGHLAAIVPRPNWTWGEEGTAVAKGFGYAGLVATLLCFGPGVGKSFIYIQF
jgi:hypothetical protein